MPKKQYNDLTIRSSKINLYFNKFLPKFVWKGIRDIGCYSIDFFDAISGRSDYMTPPCRFRLQIGPFFDINQYRLSAKEFLGYLRDLGGLRKNHNVLDVGCGIGQLATVLAEYLDKKSKYEGFDIDNKMINWCQKNISSRYSNFRFRYADIFNTYYNQKGGQNAAQYRFPYSDESFELVIVKSVFTHMFPKDIENYFSEIARVLKKGGKCLMTFFLLNRESQTLIENKRSRLDFKYFFRDYWSAISTSENAIAYKEKYVLNLLQKHGLFSADSIYYGYWCERRDFLDFQDIIIVSKGDD